MGQIQDLQKRVWQNKLTKGFNTTNVDSEFALTYGELAEAYEAHRKTTGDTGSELADTAIYLMGLAQMLGLDLETEILTKLDINEKRTYKNVNGHHIKDPKENEK